MTGARSTGPDGVGKAERDDVDDVRVLARHAFDVGQRALLSGDRPKARRWFERAHRLAPADRTVTLALATACLGADDDRAVALFTAVTAQDDVREAWTGLATAHWRRGDAARAADALAHALARHAPDAALLAAGSLADAIARLASSTGWCALAGDGTLTVRPSRPGPVTLRLDGRRVVGRVLPPRWTAARTLDVLIDGRAALGSPIRIDVIRHVDGFVETEAGGLRGWAWHPGDPEADPVLRIRPARGRGGLTVTARDSMVTVQREGPLARPRGFVVPAAALAGFTGPVHVLGQDGADLFGSPLDPAEARRAGAAAASAIARVSGWRRERGSAPTFAPPALPVDVPPSSHATGARRRKPAVDVVVPVHDSTALVLACLDSVLATVRRPSRVVVVDDASTDPALRSALDSLAAARRIVLLRQPRRLGFAATANAGIATCAGRDVALLNSDTLVPPDWLERLRAAAYGASNIGTATPLSNHASILNYPDPQGDNPVPDRAATQRLDAFARRANPDRVVDLPVAVGFCMYIRRDCLDSVGRFRAELFAQGYGEENDFCLRARLLGWRHVGVPDVFVGHVGGASFGQAGMYLRARNEKLINRLHPGYAQLVRDFIRADPLAEHRRRIDLLRWRAAGDRRRSVILVTHNDGGGVERQVVAAAAAHRAAGHRVVVLRPDATEDARPGVVVGDGPDGGFPNLRYALPDELPALVRLLRAARPIRLELHHLLGHPPEVDTLIARLGVPYDVHVHDYQWFCQRVSLVGPEHRYCGEPAPVRCDACVVDAGRIMPGNDDAQAYRARFDALLRAADRIIAPSADASGRMRRHFPPLRPIVVPHEADAGIADPPPSRAIGGTCRVCVLGAIGVHKGYDVLLACARDAAERNLPLDFVVVGHTIDDARLLNTGRVFITGRYRSDAAVQLVRAENASLGLLPSVWPETWSFGLSELWRGGLRVAAFDFGAPAERIRRTGRGFLLPVGLGPGGINNALLAAVGLAGRK